MRRHAWSALALAVPAMMIAGCGRREAPPPSRPPSRPPAVEVRPADAAGYVSLASSIDLLVIQASQLAVSQARSPRVRDVAAMLVRDHNGASAQLSFAGRRLNLLPSASMLAEHRAMLEEVRNSSDFDASYRSAMIRAHEQGLRLHGDYAATGTSPTLRPVAEVVAPIMRRHLDELRGL